MRHATPRSGARTDHVRFGSLELAYLRAVAMCFLRNRDAADGVAEESLLCAYRHGASLRGDTRLLAWLYLIASTRAQMYLRRQRQARAQLDRRRPGGGETDDGLAGLASEASSPEEEVAAPEAVALLGQECAPRHRQLFTILRLRFAEGHSVAEVARRLHLSVATVKARTRRVCVGLRARFDVAMTTR